MKMKRKKNKKVALVDHPHLPDLRCHHHLQLVLNNHHHLLVSLFRNFLDQMKDNQKKSPKTSIMKPPGGCY